MNQAELRAIDQHKYFLSLERGYDVGFDTAKENWQAHYSEAWRQQRHVHMLSLEREEINKHKWIESQKFGRDLGRQAQLDWILKYAATWRNWFEQEYEESRA